MYEIIESHSQFVFFSGGRVKNFLSAEFEKIPLNQDIAIFVLPKKFSSKIYLMGGSTSYSLEKFLKRRNNQTRTSHIDWNS